MSALCEPDTHPPPQPAPGQDLPLRHSAAPLPDRAASALLAQYFRGACPVFATNRPDLGLRSLMLSTRCSPPPPRRSKTRQQRP